MEFIRRQTVILILFFIPVYSQINSNREEPVVFEEPEWTALFDRTSGWTGSDAVYSIPFSAFDAQGNPADDTTMFLFGDTFIGEVDENNARQNSKLIRNTFGILNTKSPLPEEISFYWDTDAQDNPEALFKADTPGSDPDDWIWPMDGIRIGDRFYIYGLRLFDPPGYFSFEINGVTLISFELDAQRNMINYRHVDTPLFYKDNDDVEIVIGQAVLPMTTVSGNYGADGYIYIYGPRNRPLNFKQMVVSRVRPEHIEEFENYEFWDGSNWQSEIASCEALTDSISQEFSVTALEDGRYIAIFEFEGWVSARYADDITGPFEPLQYLYDCPEDTMYTGGFVYNAKAHPHLSDGDNLLISYNVNTSDYSELYDNADTYRPRFIRYFLAGSPSRINQPMKDIWPNGVTLQANYPNPFNPSTTIEYTVGSLRPRVRAYGNTPQQTPPPTQVETHHNTSLQTVHLTIHNVLGQKIATLVSGVKAPGKYKAVWNGFNDNGRAVSSGIYWYKLKIGEFSQARKMIYTK